MDYFDLAVFAVDCVVYRTVSQVFSGDFVTCVFQLVEKTFELRVVPR